MKSPPVHFLGNNTTNVMNPTPWDSSRFFCWALPRVTTHPDGHHILTHPSKVGPRNYIRIYRTRRQICTMAR